MTLSTKNIIGLLLIIGPLMAFIFGGVLTDVLIENMDNRAAQIQENVNHKELYFILTLLGSIGFVGVFIGATLLASSIKGDDKSDNVLARVGVILFTSLTALAIAANMTDIASLGMATSDNDKVGEVEKLANAQTAMVVGNALWAGLFFFWGVSFLIFGGALVRAKKFLISGYPIVSWLFVVFGAIFIVLFVIGGIANTDIGEIAIWIIFGLMSLNTVAAGVLQLRE